MLANAQGLVVFTKTLRRHALRLRRARQHGQADPPRAGNTLPVKHGQPAARSNGAGTQEHAVLLRPAGQKNSQAQPMPNDPGAYVVPMGRSIGKNGKTRVKTITRPGTNEVITAYPVHSRKL